MESGTEPNKTVPDPCADPAWTKQRGQGGRPTATHHHGYRQRTPQAAQGHCRAPALTWLPLKTTSLCIVDNEEVTARAHIARARLGLVLRRCPEIDTA